MKSDLKIDMSHYGYPRHIKGRLFKELQQLLSSYLQWREDENIFIWK